MSDLRKALADIGDIRSAMAAGTMFRGFGPAVMATTGLMAIATATAQSAWPWMVATPIAFVATWAATAAVCAVLIGVEMVARTRRHHAGLADAMLFNAVEHFLPTGLACVVVSLVMVSFAPDAAWLLPGLAEMLLGLGLFASTRFLPRSVAVAGGWYFLAGAASLMLAAQSRSLDPWLMGLPFGLGQLLLAAILHYAQGGDADELA